jgi:hypothetical protein
VVRKPGINSDDRSESARSVPITEIGAVSSATAYQRTPTRHLSNRENNWRKPVRPPTMPVNRMQARLGPATVARYVIGKSLAISSGGAGNLPGPPMTSSTPPHEMANVRAK